MVESGNDTLESFLNSIQVIKNAFLPLELNFRKVAKNFEHCFTDISKHGNLNGSVDDVDVELVSAQLNVEKKIGRDVVVNHDNQRKRKVPLKIFVGIFKETCGAKKHSQFDANCGCFEKLNGNAPKKRLKERYGHDKSVKEVKSYDGCLPLEVALSFLINGFMHALPNSFKADRKVLRRKSNNDTSCGKVDGKQIVVGKTRPKDLKVKEWKDLPFDCLVGFVNDQLSHLPKFDIGILNQEHKDSDSEASISPTHQFDHFKALTSIVDGKRADLSGFLGNLMFARVGGMPSSMVEAPSVKDTGEEGIGNAVNQEDSSGSPPQKLGNGLLSIPLSNVERLRSTLSTISLTELIELLPPIGRPSKEDHPDKKKLFSVQDFFRYTETEGMFYILIPILFVKLCA